VAASSRPAHLGPFQAALEIDSDLLDQLLCCFEQVGNGYSSGSNAIPCCITPNRQSLPVGRWREAWSGLLLIVGGWGGSFNALT